MIRNIQRKGQSGQHGQKFANPRVKEFMVLELILIKKRPEGLIVVTCRKINIWSKIN
jgi:hypothetical protein